MDKKTNKEVTAEILFYLSGALKNGIDGGFLAREHATSLFKTCLRNSGYEMPQKEKELIAEVK
jgi:hypothetical protein